MNVVPVTEEGKAIPVRRQGRLVLQWGVAFVAVLGAVCSEAGTVVGFSEIPVAPPAHIGFREEDRSSTAIAKGGAAGTPTSARVILDPSHDSIFLQGKVRRMYLINGRSVLAPAAANAMVFWLRVSKGSALVSGNGRNTFGAWTYH